MYGEVAGKAEAFCIILAFCDVLGGYNAPPRSLQGIKIGKG